MEHNPHAMRVLFISNDPSLFSPTSSAHARMKRYAQEIGELHIVSRGTSALFHNEHLHAYPVSGSFLFSWFAVVRKARNIIVTNQINVVSAQDPFEWGLAARIACLGTSARLQIQVHTDFLSPWFSRGVRPGMAIKNWVRARMAGTTLRAAHGIRVVSERIAKSIMRTYPNCVMPVIIPIAVSAELPALQPLPGTQDAYTFLTISRLEPEKRVGDMLNAFSKIYEKNKKVQLVVVGEGREQTRLEAHARELGIAEHVQFLGARADARALLASADCYVQVSAYEGYGLTLIEAALANVPIITTPVGIVGEVLFPEEHVRTVSIGDVAALAVAMERIMEDTALAERMTHAAAQHVQRHIRSEKETTTTFADSLRATIGAAQK